MARKIEPLIKNGAVFQNLISKTQKKVKLKVKLKNKNKKILERVKALQQPLSPTSHSRQMRVQQNPFFPKKIRVGYLTT